MSNTEKEECFLVVEPLKEVTIEPEDCTNVIEFFTHFNLAVPAYLTEAVTSFASDQNTETQDVFRVALCRALLEGKEDIFQDEIFKLINQNTVKVVELNEFTVQLKEMLTE
jgi:hypothetical protein